jgi:putative transposase
MLRNLNFALGDRLLIQQREYSFDGEIGRDGASPSDARDLGFKDVRTGAHLSLRRKAFDDLYVAGDVRLLKPYERKRDVVMAVATVEAANARYRRLWCEAFDANPCSKSEATLAAFIKRVSLEVTPAKAPPSTGALRAWLRERGAPGDRRTRFMNDRRPGGAAPLRLDPIAQRVLSEKAAAYYDGVRLNPYTVYCAMRVALVELNAARQVDGLPVVRSPSESTVNRYLRRHLDYGRATRRFGWREGGRRFVPIKGSMEAAAILDIAIIDQTLIDCTVIDDEHLINVGRPWLAMMIDVRSRYPLGFCLSFEKPSVETALACVRHGVRPKTELQQLYPSIKGEWLGFGVPDTIVVDNAWENTGSSFRDACADANISIVFAPVATPEYKGICERFFGTLNTLLFHRLPGGLPFTPQQRTRLGMDNEADAALLLSDVKRAIYQCIVEVYGRQFHKSLQAAPEQVWRKDAPLHGRPYVDDLARLDIALAKLSPAQRTLSRAGVTHNDLTYRAVEPLAELLADLLPLQPPRSARPGTAKVKVKYHPEDLSRLYVWNPVKQRYAILTCTQAAYAQNLSEHHHKLIKAFAQAEHLAFQSEDERCLARTRLRNLVLPAIPLSKVRERQNAQRLKGDRPLADLGAPPGLPEHAIVIETLANRSDDGVPHRAPGRVKARRRSVPPAGASARSWKEPTTARQPTPFADLFEAAVLSAPPTEIAPAAAGFAEFFAQTDELSPAADGASG